MCHPRAQAGVANGAGEAEIGMPRHSRNSSCRAHRQPFNGSCTLQERTNTDELCAKIGRQDDSSKQTLLEEGTSARRIDHLADLRVLVQGGQEALRALVLTDLRQ